MKTAMTLLLLLFLSSWASAQEFVVSIWGPLEMSGGGRTVKVKTEFSAVILKSGGDKISVRPLVFIHKDSVDGHGLVTGDGVNLRVGPYPDENNPVLGTVSKGDQLQLLRTFGEWVWAYYPKLPEYSLKTPRFFHHPSKVAWSKETPGLSESAVKKLVTAKTTEGFQFPFVILPSWLPPGYAATLEEVKTDDRFGPSYRVLYRKGQSTIWVDYATGGIGDRWLEKPEKQIKVDHPFLGPITVGLLKEREAAWSTHWILVPGTVTASGERFRKGNLGLKFSSDVDEDVIKKVVASLGAVK